MLRYLIISILSTTLSASLGDESNYFKTCSNHCKTVKCRGAQHLKYFESQPWYMSNLLGWDCLSECNYKCTWQTVEYFKDTQNIVPRFYKSYPLERVFGLREAASFLFLLVSTVSQIIGLIKFSKDTPKSSPIRPLIIQQGCLSILCCLSFCIYHANHGGGNDPKINKQLYASNLIIGKIVNLGLTYSILHFIYVGVYRFLWRKAPTEVRSVWVTLQIVFLGFAFVSGYVFDIKPKQFFLTNAILAFFSCVLWMFFCYRHWTILSHIWKMIVLIFAAVILFILELENIQPIYNLLDAHALWNLGICPLPILWYSFAIDDSFFLYREMSAYKVE